VLWVAGDAVPAGLRLDLPAGVRRPPPVSAALPRTPAYFPGAGAAVGPLRRPASPPDARRGTMRG
jgi:hypothetical protein